MVLKDNCGRPLLNLRIAVTRKCNLNCSYCHAEGEEDFSQNQTTEMTAKEISHIVKIAVSLDICRIKLTGGEPLMRPDIAQIIKEISNVPGLKDLSMTTNGTLLKPLAKELYSRGLKRLNISIPLLEEQAFHRLTGGKAGDAVEGVKAAIEAGFFPVKLNMPVLKGINDQAVPSMIEFASKTGTILQLIELEPINVSSEYYALRHKPLDEYENMLEQKAQKIHKRKFMQNRRIYFLPNVTVEVIRPIENTDFCLHCTRLRLTSDGRLKPCLMRNDNTTSILNAMREGANNKELLELLKQANLRRQVFYSKRGFI